MKKIVKEIFPYIIILIVVIVVRTFIATPVRVDGNSMNNNLFDGEILILNKLASINRYDVVVVKLDSEDEVIIKRVYGMPGEKLEINHNNIYINGKKIKDNYALGKTQDYAEITLGNDEYFVLGDNREISKDSRIVGPINKKEIKGQTVFRLFPFKKIGKIS